MYQKEKEGRGLILGNPRFPLVYFDFLLVYFGFCFLKGYIYIQCLLAIWIKWNISFHDNYDA